MTQSMTLHPLFIMPELGKMEVHTHCNFGAEMDGEDTAEP